MGSADPSTSTTRASGPPSSRTPTAPRSTRSSRSSPPTTRTTRSSARRAAPALRRAATPGSSTRSTERRTTPTACRWRARRSPSGTLKASPRRRSSNRSAASCSRRREAQGRGSAGDRLQVSTTATLDQALVCTGVQSDDPRAVAEFGQRITELAGRCRGVRCIGSPALCLAYVAAGRVDAFLEADSTYAWDVGAGFPVDHRGGRTDRGVRTAGRSTSGPGWPTCWRRTGASTTRWRRSSGPRRGRTVTVAGKRVVVTGGGRGIGAALAAELRTRGAEVVTADLLPGADVVCDVSDAEQVDVAVRRRRPCGRTRQQRRAARRPAAVRRDRPRRVGPHVRRQRARVVPLRQGRGASHGRPAAGASSTSPRRPPSPVLTASPTTSPRRVP